MTADCDLERLRPDHQVTFLRVAPVTDYVRHVWCRKKIHALLSTLQKDAATSFNTISQKLDPQRVQLLPRRLAEWLQDSTPEAICDELDGIEESERSRLLKSLTRLSQAQSHNNIADEQPALETLIKLKSLGKTTTGEAEKSELLKQAKNELARESDEVFFISRLVGDEVSDGYYVMLDNIGTIKRRQIFDYQSLADAETGAAHRFGRLEKTFKYAVVQRFAFLFQKIGLPEERLGLYRDALQKIG